MVKKYTRVTDEQRRELIRLIYQEQYSIKRAGQEVGIPYPNAKAVNQTYLQENRTSKKRFRFRLKNIDSGIVIPRQTILIEKLNPFEYNPSEIKRRTCGLRILDDSFLSIRHYQVENVPSMHPFAAQLQNISFQSSQLNKIQSIEPTTNIMGLQ